MVSNNKKFIPIRNGKKYLYDSTQKNEINNGYDVYLPHAAEPKDHLNNVGNLFHDSNIQNARWLKLARLYIARSKS